MRAAEELRTPRLRLRQWRPGDEVILARINSDPEVIRYLNPPAASGAFYAAATAHWAEHGFGFWAVESAVGEDAGAFLGFLGLGFPTFLPELATRVEIGWRLARRAWGRGLATEGATAARDHAFEVLGFTELISIIHPDNERSRRVAVKLGSVVERRVFHPALRRDVEVWCVRAPGPAAASPVTDR